MPRYMLDTDTCSYIMKRTHDAVLKRLASKAVSDVCVSVISKAELMYGVELSPHKQWDETALAAFLRHIEVLDFSQTAVAHYAKIRADLKVPGEMIGANDLLIAAHAQSLGLTLVTNNIREFERVHGLSIEDWAV